jgi:hypothetical protein
VLKKVHLKRNAVDRFALCGVLPGNTFVLMAARPRDSVETVCMTCIRAATDDIEQKDLATPPQLPQDSKAS